MTDEMAHNTTPHFFSAHQTSHNPAILVYFVSKFRCQSSTR